MPKGIYHILTEEDYAKIRREYLTKPIKRLAAEIGTSHSTIRRLLRKWNLVIPPEIIEQRIRASRFQNGQEPANKGKKQTEYMTPEAIARTAKTRFKKGDLPHNTRYDGHERITVDGYVEIRVSAGNYRLKHVVEWEKINGELPDSHCLLCQDGNKTNTTADNWKLTSRAENMYRNSRHKFPKEVIPSLVLVNQINNQLNTLQEDGKE